VIEADASFGESPAGLFLAMRLIEGPTLADLLRKRPGGATEEVAPPRVLAWRTSTSRSILAGQAGMVIR
jgi:hypothetical protein